MGSGQSRTGTREGTGTGGIKSQLTINSYENPIKKLIILYNKYTLIKY